MKPLNLNDQEQKDLIAFLATLSGDEILMEPPELPKYE
jgi:cytochrome c peroxidase